MSTAEPRSAARRDDILTYEDYVAEYAPVEVSEDDSGCSDPEEAGAEMAEQSLEILRAALSRR